MTEEKKETFKESRYKVPNLERALVIMVAQFAQSKKSSLQANAFIRQDRSGG